MSIKSKVAAVAAAEVTKRAMSKSKRPARSSDHKESHGIAWMVRVGILCAIAYGLVQLL